MIRDADDSPIVSRLYTLAEVRERWGVAPDVLIDLASKSDLTLCYEVPAGQWVASIDPASVYVKGQDYVQDKWVRRTRPDRAGGMPSPAQPSIKALLVDPIDCLRAVRTSTKQELFRRAYMITAEPFILAPDAPAIVTPSRMPLFSRDGKTTLDQSHCRFGLYPDDVEFTFRDEYGYRPPLEVDPTSNLPPRSAGYRARSRAHSQVALSRGRRELRTLCFAGRNRQGLKPPGSRMADAWWGPVGGWSACGSVS